MNKDIGKRMREARKDAGLTQEQLATRLGCTPNHYCKIERGKSGPGRSLVALFCSLLNVNLDWLLTGTGPKELHVAPPPVKGVHPKDRNPDEVDTSTLGGRMLWVRLQLGYDLKRMGDALGISSTQVRYIEGNKRPSNRTLEKLYCALFGLSEAWLVHGHGEPHTDTTGSIDRVD